MRRFTQISALFGIVLSMAGCKTDDVQPINGGQPSVSISIGATSIPENGGVFEVTATLSEPSASAVLVTLLFGGTAIDGVDYSVSSTQINIPANSLTGSATVSAIQDTLQEGNENIDISIQSAAGAIANSSEVLSVFIEDDDVPFQAQIIINEILYDPSNSGLSGDANGDGVYSQAEDEFIEFVNLSSQAVDFSGYMIYDETGLADGVPRHTIPSGTIVPAGGALVIFGGGTPTGLFGGAIVQTSTTANMNMTNAGDIMTLTDALGVTVVSIDITPFSDNPNESYTRDPDITGIFEQHGFVQSTLFSPGTKSDGTSF